MAVFGQEPKEEVAKPASLMEQRLEMDTELGQMAPPPRGVVARVAMCSECKTIHDDAVVERNIFYQQGGSMPCVYCGGVVVIVPEHLSVTERFKDHLDQLRGIGSTLDINY